MSCLPYCCFLPFDMDIKTLLDNLHEEVSCSVCMCKFTDPKQLPCLHSFCLHCLNGIQRTSANPNVIACPECRQEFRVPENGNLQALPTNFRINSLLHVLAIKECNTSGVKCGNCDKKSEHSFYCFQCCAFWCDDCIGLHNGIRANKEHHALALKDFQDQDFENILNQPAFCGKPGHEKKELEFFCKSCEVAICYSCVATVHDGHPKILLDEAANERKLHIKAAIESQKQIALQKKEKISKIQGNCENIQAQVDYVKKDAQMFVDSMIAALEAKKKDIFNDLDKKANETLQLLGAQQLEVEFQVAEIETAIEKAEQLLQRRSNAEITKLDTNTIFQREYNDKGQDECDFKNLRHFVFVQNEMLMDKVNSVASVKVNGDHVYGSPFKVQVNARQYRPVLSFGQKGHSFGRFNQPWGVAVNQRDEIAVTDRKNHRVQIFDCDGTFVRSFGCMGDQEGEFNEPTGIAFHNDNIAVVDRNNHRVQVFSAQGEFLYQFGGKGNLNHQLNLPLGLSVDCEGNILVADPRNKSIKIFSPWSQFLRKISQSRSSFIYNFFPWQCIQHEKLLVVSDSYEHCVKVFDKEGVFLYKFGEKGRKKGKFNEPNGLTVNKEGHLMVCDAMNHRVQVFEMSGKFVTNFGISGSGKGELKEPVSMAVLSDGKIVVSDFKNDRIQVFE